MSPELHSELQDLIHFAWASSLMHTAGGRILRLLAGYVRVQWVRLNRAIMCENVHMYSGDSGRRQSGNICTGGENESAFNTWRELNVLSAAH